MKTKTKTKTNRGCKCIDKVDELLRKQGASLDIAFMVPEMYCRVSISTYRVQPRAKLRRLVANFCPFCGKKYPERPEPKIKKAKHA